MADFTKNTVADMATDRVDINTGTQPTLRTVEWGTEDLYWREHYRSRPYVATDRGYEHYRPAYRFATERYATHGGRRWDDAETDLEREWRERTEGTGSAWAEVKEAVRDAWHRLTHPERGSDEAPPRRTS